ncbi:MAG TPA: histidine phosphatase family protein [Anaerolineales bacterium]|jgi:broad specificity phosphatase PhoE|nr:histidine phosphatase family protein [Anaerolineales bacterium]
MKPNRILLVRHGQSEANVDRKKSETIQDFALNLTEEGVKQADNAGGEIKTIIGEESVHVYLSPYFRTRQTYQHIEKSIKPNVVKVFEDPRIREQDWGHLRPFDANEEINNERDNFSTFYYRIPDGESGADVYDRVSTFLETLFRDFADPDYPQNTLIVTHGMTMRLFLMRWFHWTVEEFENLKNPKNCQIVVMQKDAQDRYTLISELAKRK